jgi:uncharacterized protein (UPF0248 family)
LTLRDVLNRIRWDREKTKLSYEVSYVHRGATGDKRTIPFSNIREIHSSWFMYTDPDDGDVMIPFHRVLEVREVGSEQILWRSRRQRS